MKQTIFKNMIIWCSDIMNAKTLDDSFEILCLYRHMVYLCYENGDIDEKFMRFVRRRLRCAYDTLAEELDSYRFKHYHFRRCLR